MTLLSLWTIADVDGAYPATPSIAYVINAHDRDDAIADASHTNLYGWPADPRTPPAGSWYGWADLPKPSARPSQPILFGQVTA